MSSRAVPQSPASAPAPRTRREIREAERRRGRAHPPITAASRRAPAPAPGADHSARAEAAVTEMLPAPRRRELRAVHSRPHRLTWRHALVGGLGAIAIAAPVVGGLDRAGNAAAASAVDAQPSTLRTLEDSAEDTLETPEALRADPKAPERAAAASRAAEREAIEAQQAAEEAAAQKVAEEKAAEEKAAEEARAAAEAAANRVIMPLAAGSYHNTSGYGPRVDPLGRGFGEHLGTDMAAPVGTPIHAAAAGTVVHAGAGKDGRSSNLIIIEHTIRGETYFTWYVHMFDDGVHVTEGQQVAAGEVIGAVGNNGNSTGPHLHFEVHLADGETTVEPLAWLSEHGAVDVGEI